MQLNRLKNNRFKYRAKKQVGDCRLHLLCTVYDLDDIEARGDEALSWQTRYFSCNWLGEVLLFYSVDTPSLHFCSSCSHCGVSVVSDVASEDPSPGCVLF